MAQPFVVTIWDRALARVQNAQAALDERTLEFVGDAAALQAIKRDARHLASRFR